MGPRYDVITPGRFFTQVGRFDIYTVDYRKNWWIIAYADQQIIGIGRPQWHDIAGNLAISIVSTWDSFTDDERDMLRAFVAFNEEH